MKFYRNEVWDMIENYFVVFNITYIPRDHNQTADSLALTATHFRIPKTIQLKYPIEVRYRPSVPDNVKHWKFFEDDIEIKRFLELTGDFSNSLIDQEEDDEVEDFEDIAKNEIASHQIIVLKSNFIPKGLVQLERIFSNLKPVVQSLEENVVDCNIGTPEHPRMVKILKALTTEQRKGYIKLLKEYVDVFSWSYEYLKTYDTGIIQHKVPSKTEC